MPTEKEAERRGEGEEGRTQEEQDRAAEGGDTRPRDPDEPRVPSQRPARRHEMKCSLCGRLFGSDLELQDHMEQEHEADSAEQNHASS